MKKLSEFYYDFDDGLPVSLVDNVFFDLRKKGIKEIEVNDNEYNIIVRFFLANCSNSHLGAEVTRTFQLDMFMGVKLICTK